MNEHDMNNNDFFIHFETEERTLKSHLQEMRVTAELAKMDARDGIKKQLSDLDHKLNDWKASMNSAKKSSSEGWEETKEKLSASWKEIKEGFSKARAALTDNEDEAS